ncbi:hypothetical protein HOLleu_39391 [Holothuria leucospilota]|uniref:Guanylate-binding protein/Atlastin C-terminal domain-containing protein n=1 Tax=Holothuria leucospilota TaxID=206669 RepID=A0A9Q0YIJ4_HOLLE|nr:hypothetical protein HOLleu_39391 [Holothuria leucospilota]
MLYYLVKFEICFHHFSIFFHKANSNTYRKKADNTNTDQLAVNQSEKEKDDTEQPQAAKGQISETGETKVQSVLDETPQTVHDQASSNTYQNEPDNPETDRLDLEQSETDKLHIENVSELVVKSQLNSSTSKAMQVYNELFKNIELPMEAHELSIVHQKAMVEAHSTFDKWTRRIDEMFTNVFKQELSQKINLLFDNLGEENNKASESYCVKLMESLQERLEGCLQTNFKSYGCEDIRKAKKNFLKSYSKDAKGPMADKVRAIYEPQITKLLSKYKAQSFNNAELNALKIYKDKTKMSKSAPFENDEIKESHENAQKICLDTLYVICDQCSDCQKEISSFCDKLSGLLVENLTINESASQLFCEQNAQELTRRHFEEAKKFVHSRSFRFFQKVSDTVLKEYDQKAKGPAKDDVKGKCKRDLESQMDTIEVIVAENAFKDARELYDHDVEQVMKGGPYEVEKLKEKIETIKKHTFSSLNERCEGIRKMKLDEHNLLLKRFMEDKNTYIFCRNIIQSESSCDELCMEIVRKCQLELSKFGTFAVSKKLNESLDLSNMLDGIRKDLIRTYLEKAKGPMKNKIMERLHILIDLNFVETQGVVLNDTLGKATVQFDKLLDDLSTHGPHDEKELVENLKTAENKVLFMFDDRSKKFDTLYVNSARENLQKVLDAMKNKCVYRNESQSFRICDSVMMKITKRHSDYWEKNIFTVDFDKASVLYNLFTTRKEDYIEDFKKDAKGPASTKFEQKCRIEIDRQIRDFQNFLANSNLRILISNFRQTISKNIIENMPLEDKELDKRKAEEMSTLSRDFGCIYKMSDEEDAKSKQKELEAIAADILSKLDGINYKESQKQCEHILKNMLDILEEKCTFLLRDCTDRPLHTKFYPMEELQKIKTGRLDYFEKMAKGPAKSEVKQKGSNEIDRRLLQIKRSIAKDALEKAGKIYHSKFSAIQDEEFLDDMNLSKLKDQSAIDVKKLFRERCKDSDSAMTKDFEKLLQKAVSEENTKIDTRHANLSLEFCQQLAKTLSAHAKKECQQLITLDQTQNSDQYSDISLRIKEIERIHIAEYNQNARGIQRTNVFKTYEITIQNELQSAAREISRCYLTKALDRFKSKMEHFMETGPYEKETFFSQSKTFTLEEEMFFQERCKKLDTSIYSNDYDMLKCYLESFTDDFQTENELQSLKYCNNLLKDLLATRKRYKRKFLFIRAYKARAKGPMVQEALSKFMDPIDTHYRSWYALFHRW